MTINHQHLTRTLAISAVLLASGGVPSANAAAPATETITMTWVRSGDASAPPFRGAGSGTFADTGPVTDAGALTLVGQDVAVPSPVRAAAWTDRMLAGSQGTLELRCFEQTTTFSNPDAIPFTGSCSVVGGTGNYSSVHGQGSFTSALLDMSTSTVSEMLDLNDSNLS